jgi:hypothetical protein
MWIDAERDEDELDDGYGTPQDQEDDGVDDPDAYWRRRFLILATGVAVVVLAVWLYPGGTATAPRQTPTARASMASLAKGSPLPTAAYGDPYPTATLIPSASARPAASAKPSHARHRPGTAYHPRPSATPSASASPKASAAKCAPASIVLSLFTTQPSYGPSARPVFDVYAVSTATAACQLPYGPGSVRVVVTDHGRVVWDSAACKPPSAAPVTFKLGVPQLLAISWNRKAAKPAGCAGTLPAGSTGTFDAVAMTAGQSSQVRTFKLSS